MDQAGEKQVLASLYDRLMDAVTYAPEGKSAPSHKDTTFIQMAKNLVLDPNDFKNMFNPGNPNGDQRTAELFSAMVDAVPGTDPAWSDSGNKISNFYEIIVANANTENKINEKQKATYDEAYKFLNTETTTKDFRGNDKTVTDPSAIAIAYVDNQTSYIAAVSGFRTAYLGYNLDVTADQRAWNAVAPTLQNNINQAWNKWGREGKAEVEQAQNALASTINDAIAAVITVARYDPFVRQKSTHLRACPMPGIVQK